MDLKLEGQSAFVSGSSAGIGFAIGVALAREGARVVLNSRTQKRLDDSIAALMDRVPGARVSGVAADLSTRAGADAVIAAEPTIDILINNMGIYQPAPFAEITDESWMATFETNVLSGIRLARHYLPAMLEADRGRIIFISSESGVQIPEEMIHYGMTKAALIAVARGIAELTRHTSVTVNSVLVGPTASEGVTDGFIADIARSRGITPEQIEREFFQTVRPSSLLQRFETPEEVAQVIAFLASPLAGVINGAPVRADGGVIRGAF